MVDPAFWRRARRHPGFVTGLLLTGLLVMVALVSVWWTPVAPDEMDLEAMLAGPSAAHWLGTDAFGRDVGSLLMQGAQASLLAGVIAVGIGLGAGLLLGLLAAARPGRLSAAIMRTADFMLAFPALLTAIMLTAVFGAGLTNAIVAVGIYNIPSFVRITRAAAAGVWSREYALADTRLRAEWLANHAAPCAAQHSAAAAGAGHRALCRGHSGRGGPVVSGLWRAAAAAVLGADAGRCPARAVRGALQALWPGLAIMLAVLGLNLLGDGLRDLLDPSSGTNESMTHAGSPR